MKTTNQFIESQQELARDTLIQSDASGFANLSDSEVDEIIAQIIKNTGEELLRLEKELDHRDNHICRFNDFPQKCECYHGGVDTLKKHITSVTGVE